MDKQVKKDAKLSVKNNESKRTFGGSESFPWILPEQAGEQENVIMLDEKRKKKRSIPKVKEEMNELLQQKRKKRRNREGMLFVLFAVVIGVGFGLGLLKMIQSSSEQTAASVEEKSVSITLDSLEVYILQSGAFTDVSRAEKLEEQLLMEGGPATIIEADKAYVISGIAATEENIDKINEQGTAYKKTFTIPAADMESSNEQEGEKIQLIRNIIEKMIQSDGATSEEEWTELSEQVETLKKVESNKEDKELYESTLKAYEVLTSNKGNINTQTQQALLDCFDNYQKYIYKGIEVN